MSLIFTSWTALKCACSGNQVAVDVTEQAIEQPWESQGDYYSGKKLPAIKILFTVIY